MMGVCLFERVVWKIIKNIVSVHTHIQTGRMKEEKTKGRKREEKKNHEISYVNELGRGQESRARGASHRRAGLSPRVVR